MFQLGLLGGRRITNANPAQAVNNGIGYLSEDRKRYGLMLGLDLTHNMVISSIHERFTKAGVFEARKGMRKIAAEQVRLLKTKTPSVDQLVRNLSGGNQQKVIISRWLVRNCDVLIFDEPTRGIDVGAKQEIYDLLNQLAEEQNKSIIMISSELPEILRMSHPIVARSHRPATPHPGRSPSSPSRSCGPSHQSPHRQPRTNALA